MSELTQRVKAKYPQYANVPDNVLEQKVLQKYPQYKPYASKSIGGFVENVGKSGFNAVKDIAGAAVNVLNPNMEKNTLANLAKLGIDTAKLVAGDKSELNRASQVVSFYKQRYGGADNISNTIYNDPVGFLLDASVVLGGSGAVLRGAGAVSKVSGLSRAGSALSRAGATIDPFVQAGKLAKGGVSSVFRKIPKTLDTFADNAVLRGAGKQPDKLTGSLKRAKTTAPKYIEKYDLYNRSSEAVSKLNADLNTLYDDIGIKNPTKTLVGEIIKGLDREIEKITSSDLRFSTSGQKQLLKLQELKDQFLQSSGATYSNPIKPAQKLTLMPDGSLKMVSEAIDPALKERFLSAVPLETDTNKLIQFRKNAIDPDIPQSMFGLDPSGSGSAVGAKTARNIFRKTINKADPRLEQIGLDIGVSKQMQKFFEAGEKRQIGRQPFNFTKLGSAGIGSVIAGAPGVVAGFATEQILNSPKTAKAASKTARNVSTALKSVKILPKIKRFTQGVGAGYAGAKYGRAFSPDPTLSKSTNIKTTPQQVQEPVSYKPIVPSPATPDPKKVKPLEYKQPKSIFANKSTFGSTKKVQRGSFY